MISDIRLYTVDSVQDQGVQMKSAYLSSTPATGLEILGNKVVKFLKTTRGSDAMDPSYGGNAFSTPQISQEYLPKFRMELENDIARCTAYIKSSEFKHRSILDRLARITLRRIDYDPAVRPTTIHIYLEILTTYRNKAKVSVSHIMG